MYWKSLAAAGAALLIGAGPAWADETQPSAPQPEAAQEAVRQEVTAVTIATPEQIQERFEARFPGVEVSEVRDTPFDGLYEIRIGRDLLYADANVDFLLQGALIDTQSRKDLTAQRLEELSRVAFSDLPLEIAVKQVYGDGTHQLAVFEDPNCGYCKRFHKTLQEVGDTTVYTFLFPILSDDSTVKSRNVWCAKDQAKVWKAWMLDGETPPEAECDVPLDDLMALGRRLMVEGTPAIVFADGSRVNGAMTQEALEEKLASLAKGS